VAADENRGWRSIRLPLTAAVIGIALTAPSLDSGLVADDLIQRELIGKVLTNKLPGSFWDLYAQVPDNPRAVTALRSVGALPWWTWPGVHIAFFRPLTALTQYVDYLLWPGSPAAMHAQSLLWYGLLCWLVALFFRRTLDGAAAAVIAALIFAVDDLHGPCVGWIASRNTLVAAVFCTLSLLAHQRWRLRGWRPGAVLSPLCFALSLLAAEIGVTTLAFLIAFALTLDRRPLASRARALVPALLVFLVWCAAYRWLGYGAHGSGTYVDPLNDPVGYLQLLPERLGLLAGTLVTIPAPFADRLTSLAWILVAAATGLFVLAYALGRLRGSADVRFCLFASGLALLPLAAAPVHPRLLLLASIPAAGLFARVIVDAVLLVAPLRRAAGLRPFLPRAAAWAVLAVVAILHLALAPVGLVLAAEPPVSPVERVCSVECDALDDVPHLERRQLIIVNAPDTYGALLIPINRRAAGRPAPALTYLWSTGRGPVHVTRVDDRTLELRGPGWLEGDPFARSFRNRAHPLRPGELIQLRTHQVRVLALAPDGRPARVQFRFAFPIDRDPLLVMMSWDGRRFRRFWPPAVGQTVRPR
jgi:hypothetical protein